MKLLVALIIVALPVSSLGLKCYECTHLSPNIPGEDSTINPLCATPAPAYLIDCEDSEVIPIPIYPKMFLSMIGMDVSRLENNGKQQNSKYSCASLVGAGYGVTGAARGCVTNVPDICEKAGQDAAVEMCFCNTDGCNNHQIPADPSP